jgi:hypothetical protein
MCGLKYQRLFAMAPYSLKRSRARAREAGFDEVELSPFNNALPRVVQSVADYPSQGGFQQTCMMMVQYATRLLEAQWRIRSIAPVVWAPDPPLPYALVCNLPFGPKCIGTRVRSGSV